MLDLVIFLALLAFGYGFGRYTELNHYISLLSREKKMNTLPATIARTHPASEMPCDSTLVTGSMVISVDYFKRFISILQNLISGRVASYESLIDRARREAILRMKEQAQKSGAKAVLNIKFEIVSIYRGNRRQIGSVEVLAYGTAIIPIQER